MNNYDYYDYSELKEHMEMEEVLRILNAVPNFDDLEESLWYTQCDSELDDWEEDDLEEDAY